jgi:hypothetical protein
MREGDCANERHPLTRDDRARAGGAALHGDDHEQAEIEAWRSLGERLGVRLAYR